MSKEIENHKKAWEVSPNARTLDELGVPEFAHPERQENLARKLHEWYLEATARLHPESYNPNAQKPYDAMTEEQKFMDRYIAGKIIELYK